MDKKDVKIDVTEQNNKENSSLNAEKNTVKYNKLNDIDNKYVTTYDASKQSYVIYNTSEIIKSNSPKVETENEKINQDKDLISYYTNLSTGTSILQNTGIIIIVLIIASIGVILIVLYRRVNR